MKNNHLFVFRLFVMSMMCIIIIFAGCEKDPEWNADPNTPVDERYTNEISDNLQLLTISSDNLTEAELASLYFMVEEEKLAKDVYNEMYNMWGLLIFYNIYLSEIQHENAISRLFEKYDLTNPNDSNLPGEYDNEELQQLFDDLIEQGSASVKEAIAVGVQIELKDLEDIQYYLDYIVESKDIERVYENLLAGSEIHLAAFVSHQK